MIAVGADHDILAPELGIAPGQDRDHVARRRVDLLEPDVDRRRLADVALDGLLERLAEHGRRDPRRNRHVDPTPAEPTAATGGRGVRRRKCSPASGLDGVDEGRATAAAAEAAPATGMQLVTGHGHHGCGGRHHLLVGLLRQ